MSMETNEVIREDDASQRVYEVGYLLLPSIPEEKISEEVSLIETAMKKHAGALIAQGEPTLQPLAYQMMKEVGTRNERFDTAYFGWVKFEMEPEGVLAFKGDLDGNSSVLRFILIKTSRDAHLPRVIEEKEEGVVEKKASDALPKTTPSISEAEIDKSIEELVLE